jgi:hypothetical protein
MNDATAPSSRRVRNQLGDFASTDTPLGAQFESRQFFAVDHVPYCLSRQIQPFTRLAWSQRERLNSLDHGQPSNASNGKRCLGELRKNVTSSYADR